MPADVTAVTAVDHNKHIAVTVPSEGGVEAVHMPTRRGEAQVSVMQHLDELEERQMQLEDIPSEWWLHGSDSGEGITNENLTAFNSLPGKMEKAVAKAVGGIRVYLDGQAVGYLVTPYVSQNIALDIG